jgi:predicted amidohydrolase YtcJ
MIKNFLICHAVIFYFIAQPTISLAQSADIILTHGKIFTSDQNQLFVEALAIKGNRIITTGTDKDIIKYTGTATYRINLEGKTVLPGFNDAHDHLGWNNPPGLTFSYPEIPAGPDKGQLLDSISRLVRLAKPGQWFSGWIGTQVLFDTTMRDALDRLAPSNPVVLLKFGSDQDK